MLVVKKESNYRIHHLRTMDMSTKFNTLVFQTTPKWWIDQPMLLFLELYLLAFRVLAQRIQTFNFTSFEFLVCSLQVLFSQVEMFGSRVSLIDHSSFWETRLTACWVACSIMTYTSFECLCVNVCLTFGCCVHRRWGWMVGHLRLNTRSPLSSESSCAWEPDALTDSELLHVL